jgi:Amt family ammonium transporter
MAVTPLWAQDAAATDTAETPVAKLDSGDTAWMLTSSALVIMMTVPGLALFYGGLVRSKNVLSTLMHSFFCAALLSIAWIVVGYTIAFGPEGNAFIGSFKNFGLAGLVGQTNGTIPALLFVMFQGTFFIITPALISGTFAERIRFSSFAVLMLLWSVIIYAPLCHWVWGGGWIGEMGALDFAGGTVVHISSGVSALVMAFYLGKRVGYGTEPMPPHNLPFTVIGASLLWVGWFGFNAGSALGANELASVAFINTNTGAAAAALGWLLAEWLKTGKPTILGAASGAVAGLVAITPAAGFVPPMAAIAIGGIGGVACFFAVSLKPRFGYDDALDVVGVHFVGGSVGAILTGVFARADIGGTDGLLYGNPGQLWTQIVAVLATYAYCGIGMLILLVIVDKIFKLRPSEDEEVVGLDLSQHSERAYAWAGTGSVALVGGNGGPRAASAPPAGERFTITLDGIDADAMLNHWRNLCQDHGGPPSEAFTSVYSQMSTVRGTKFRFRGGNPDKIRQNLEDLFKNVSKSTSAKVES